jgi:hypothetical protein
MAVMHLTKLSKIVNPFATSVLPQSNLEDAFVWVSIT